MPSVSHDAFSVSDVKIASHFVYTHVAVNSAPLSFLSVSEGIGVVADALLRMLEDICVTPTLRVICVSQLIASIAAPA